VDSARPRVVIIGGGFAGLYAAKALQRAPVDVLLLDRRNHHVFQPLLYQVATAGLGAIEIGEPIRRILRKQANTTVLLAEVTTIDAAARHLSTADGRTIPYDFLIVASGAVDSYFGHPEWERFAPGLKTIEDAMRIRRRILLAFEEAELTEDEHERDAWQTFVIIGGGPTGAELAGAVAELARHTLVDEFRRFHTHEARILLIEGSNRILSTYPPQLSEKARHQLERLGVAVLTGSLVTGIDERGVTIGDRRIDTRTVLWAAGVRASPLGVALGVPVDRTGRVHVEPDLSVPGHPEVFVVGDLASLESVPGVAPAAIQMGKHAAASVTASLKGMDREPFRYVDRGSMATLGRRSAIAEIRGLRLSGFLAWAAWLTIHIFFLIGFRNRAVVLFEWARSYLTYNRSARLILLDRES
jgi:NADH:ubiquinone reductase (H+-translocating)